MRCGASVTCAPLRRRQMVCFSRACPYPAAALLCHLGPLLHFRKSASSGLLPTSASGRATGTQPTSVTALGGPAVSIQLLQGPRGAGGPWPDGICPGPHSARRPGRAVRSCIWNWVGASQARCGRPETNAGPLLRAGAACKPVASIGPATGRASPRTVLAGMLVTDPQTRAACGSCMLRYQA